MDRPLDMHNGVVESQEGQFVVALKTWTWELDGDIVEVGRKKCIMDQDIFKDMLRSGKCQIVLALRIWTSAFDQGTFKLP